MQPTTDFPERLVELKRIWVVPRGLPPRQADVRRVTEHTTKSLWVIGLHGTNTRSAAEALVGAELQIEAEQAAPLPPGTYYEHDIIGLVAVTTDGLELGPVTDVIRTGANDVYVTKRCLIPAIAHVVKDIDIAAGRMLIEPVPGLLDEEE